MLSTEPQQVFYTLVHCSYLQECIATLDACQEPLHILVNHEQVHHVSVQSSILLAMQYLYP